ncbi:hypothetical protein [Chitinilyticum piscinae]|uniref:Uncharacterized protein n=1 Tax=Chitinilyticum piscinae TaxID=2866724 RepID=A0A8J7G1T7_9NEIS|nr:hypothetical protein [Chitinilyticum piscinae]MBE9610415.1 hypothetical protein [Chitinilyticum piscinae]
MPTTLPALASLGEHAKPCPNNSLSQTPLSRASDGYGMGKTAWLYRKMLIYKDFKIWLQIDDY